MKQKLHSPDNKNAHWHYICPVCHTPVETHMAFYEGGKQKHLECLNKSL